jgi:drug/metabolite transporter (DMT)-like permease
VNGEHAARPLAGDITPRPVAGESLPKAAGWMAGWLALMVVMAIAGRGATFELPVFQVMEVRSLIGLVLLAPLVHRAGGLAAMRTAMRGRHALRNAVHYGAQFGWFVALTMIPLAQLVAIEFTMPLWTALLAAPLLGERLTLRKLAAVAVGIVGVALIVRPTAGALQPGQLIALAAAVGFAISVVLVKSLTRTEGVVAIIFWMLVVQSVLGLVPALWVWRWPSATAWAWLVVIAFCGTFSHYCMTRVMHHADATVVVPMDFLRVPLTAAAAWWVYAESVDLWTALGAALILAANLVNLLRRKTSPGSRALQPPRAADAVPDRRAGE